MLTTKLMNIIFLAEDDSDDRDFFAEALKDLKVNSQLTMSKDGVELMTNLKLITTEPPPPHVIFLDLNMPFKNGFECLEEIKNNPRLKNIPVAIFSTSANDNDVLTTYSLGANCFICKPTSHIQLKKVIETVLMLDLWKQNQQLPKEKYVLTIN